MKVGVSESSLDPADHLVFKVLPMNVSLLT